MQVRRALPREQVAAARAIAARRGWLPDALLAGAWALTLERLLGTAELAEIGSSGALSRACVTPAPDRAALDALAAIDEARRAPQPARDATEHAWIPAGPGDGPLAASLVLGPSGEGLEARADPAVFDAVALAALLQCVAQAMAALVEAGDRAWGDIDILGAAQRETLLRAWNPPPAPYDRALTVDALFRRQARATPAAVALAGDEGALDYAALERRAEAVAHRLALAGTRRGDVIGVALDRGFDAIAVLLGILQAGAAYLPLDLRHPRERIAFMLADARAARVVARARDAASFPRDVAVLEAEALCAPMADPQAQGAQAGHDAEALAYVMYTSGSTGEPKGIEICHRSIVRLVHGVDYVRLGAGEAVLHAAPLGFDASTFEIWGALLTGGRCVLHAEAVPTGPGLARAIRDHGVTTAWLTAALFNAVVDDDPAYLGGLRQLLTGGEALSVPHVRRALAALPEVTLINGYGPTECTTFTATYRIPRELPADARSIPIGRPIAATSVYVLDARMQPVPIGVLGELWVGGRGLARAYLGREALTAERFAADPFGGEGGRLYRTGDIVRWLPEGVIEFVGRRDSQVKIRGYRIELGEIEVALSSHPDVKACAVEAKPGAGGMRLVAYVVPASPRLDTAALRADLLARMPDFMVPAAFVTLAALPVTANGKLDRRALPMPGSERPRLAQPYLAPIGPAEERLCRVFAEVLGLDRVGRRDNFFELGGSSLLVMQAIARFEEQGGSPIATTLFFQDPTPAALAAALDPATRPGVDARRLSSGRHASTRGRDAIAVIAMAGRFPGAADVEAFWENLRAGRETITRFADAELDPSIPAAVRSDPAYVRARGVIDGVEMFDAEFFGISPREADLMDPQQRLFMELCWECLERGGYVPESAKGPVGVFGGMYNATYFQRHVSAHPGEIARLGEFQVMLANEKDYVATRTANRLDLTGPAVSVHTACSTSLVAIVQAVTSLRARQCDYALAGGASVTCPPRSGYLYQEGSMLAPDGHTRSFDAAAEGTVFSDGAAVVLLKRLDDALADGDPIHAVIRGVAVNNDGGAKASFTAPSVDGQAAVIAAALDDAAIDARAIEYVEAHGTATPLGDPVEVEALTRAFRRDTADTGFCRLGSVKSNLGHLVIAAGATGLIKTALALAREEIPATLHYATANPKLALALSPFTVNDRLTPWPRRDSPRHAGVSAFGVGGTNAHVVMEEPPPFRASDAATGPQLLQLSARTAPALEAAMQRLATHLERHPGENLADVAFTLRAGRRAFPHRAAVVAETAAEAVTALRDPKSENTLRGMAGAAAPRVAFMFPGQAAQYASMGSGLYASEPAFRAAFDECVAALGPEGADLRERLFGGDAAALTQTALTQPALFCVEYALARAWLALGVRPCALLGHSVGEFVAATVAGVFRLDEAVRLVARRGQLMQALPAGAMLAVRAAADQVATRLSKAVALAAENSPGLCVVAGPADDVEHLRSALEAEGIVSRLLQTSHAFHSSMMDAAVAPFEASVRAVALSPPSIPIYSTVSGRLLTDAEACDPGYWARHLRETVRFSPALVTAAAATGATFLEVGPRATLTTLARQHAGAGRAAPVAIASLADAPAREPAALRLAAARLWSSGGEVDLASFDSRARKQRVVLPTYPFERKRHWVEAAPAGGSIPLARAAPAAPLPEPSMNAIPAAPPAASRVPALIARLRGILEDISGLDLAEADAAAPLVELGLDSLSLTQVAIQLKQAFKVNVTFRQLMEQHRTLEALAVHLDAQMPAESAAVASPAAPAAPLVAMPAAPFAAMPGAVSGAPQSLVEQVIAQQMQLMAQQLALLQGQGAAPIAATPPVAAPPAVAAPQAEPPRESASAAAASEVPAGPGKYDVKKAFGAIARIHTDAAEITDRQRARLDAFMRRYIARTKLSKEYTIQHRPHLADPRVVNGFRPLLKEIIYQIVIERSRGSHVWDLDGNEYVDVLSGFGMNMFGWHPDFVNEAVHRQLDTGYEIGPQHPLAGEVAKRVCEFTGFDRVGLCNTGSEAVMGAVRIARTVTGRSTIVMFTGSYHGIFDEVIVRATKKLRAVPAAPGILPNTSLNVLVLDYGTPESMEIIKARAGELAAVLVEPVQSRRPDFQPVEFLKELRQVTQDNGALLIFDEVVTGFRSHPGGVQALFGIRADLGTYGKVVGGGFPIGVIAGKREYMDALDGGAWQYGDDSIPTVGVTYFAGTFVRHPLALVAAKAVLEHLKREGPELQAKLTRDTAAMVDELNAYCAEVGAPIALKTFASVWRINFTEDHPLQDLLFAMMRSRGVHILDNFPCFFTTAHTAADVAAIKTAFKESVAELQEAGFLPRRPQPAVLDASRPPVPGARLGKDPDGKPAWYVVNPERPGKYVKVES